MKVASHALGQETQGTPDLCVSPVEYTPGRQHADDDRGLTVQSDGASDYAGIGAELRFPKSVAQDRDVVLTSLIFFRQKGTAEDRLDAEDIKIMRRYLVAAKADGLADSRERDR